MSDLTDAVDGFDAGDAVARSWQGDGAKVSSVTGIVSTKLAQRRHLTARGVPFLHEHAHGAYKMTLPSATQFPAISWKKGVTDAAYPTPADLLAGHLPRSSRARWRRLAAEGVPYIQIDARATATTSTRSLARVAPHRDGQRPGRVCSTKRWPADSARLRGGPPAGHRRSRFICAAATTAATGTRKAATTTSPRSCSTRSTRRSLPARVRR